MTLHHLDPRRAGTSAQRRRRSIAAQAEPDVRTFLVGHDSWRCETIPDHQCGASYPTEAAALAAARQAAGLGHVAERACGRFKRPACTWGTQCSNPHHEDTCQTCAWPRDAHGKGDNDANR